MTVVSSSPLPPVFLVERGALCLNMGRRLGLAARPVTCPGFFSLGNKVQRHRSSFAQWQDHHRIAFRV